MHNLLKSYLQILGQSFISRYTIYFALRLSRTIHFACLVQLSWIVINFCSRDLILIGPTISVWILSKGVSFNCSITISDLKICLVILYCSQSWHIFDLYGFLMKFSQEFMNLWSLLQEFCSFDLQLRYFSFFLYSMV